MKNKNQKINFELIQRSFGYLLTNRIIFQEIDKFDYKIGKRLQKKFRLKNYFIEGEKNEENYFKSIILKLAYQIIIQEELKRELLRLSSVTNCYTEERLRNPVKFEAIKEAKK